MNAENNGFGGLQTLHFHFQGETETSTALTDDQFNPSRTREPNIFCDQIDRCHSVDCLDRLSKGNSLSVPFRGQELFYDQIHSAVVLGRTSGNQ